MATTFTAAAYRTALQTLLDRHPGPAHPGLTAPRWINVEGFTERRDWQKFSAPVAEIQFDRVPLEQVGVSRVLDATIEASLLVMVRLDHDQAEEACLELALDVATALIDEVESIEELDPMYPQPAAKTPVMPGGPIKVTGIEPDYPDGALAHRVVAFRVTYEQSMRISRLNQPADPQPYTTLYTGRAPDIGLGHEGDYTRRVPPEPLE